MIVDTHAFSDPTVGDSTNGDPGYAELLQRVESLQFELAQLRAEVMGRVPVGDALRRATAFDSSLEPARRRPPCSPRTAAPADPCPTATTRSLDANGRDVTTIGTETALRAISAAGRGAVFAGARAAIRLLPNDDVGPATIGQPGDLQVDADHALWFFGAAGWTRIA